MNQALETVSSMATFLAGTLPYAYEIRLFDCTEKGMPIVRQFNTKRGYDNALRKYIRSMLKIPAVTENDMLLNRADVGIKDKLYKTSFYIVKDTDERIVGVLTVSIMLNDYFAAYGLLESVLTAATEEIDKIQATPLPDGGTPTLERIDAIVRENSEAPERLTPEEKMELFIDLYDEGVFELKGAVAKAAEALHMSEQSVYRYLAQIRRARGE
ncbi:MAG: helix-turn-helix domain-containing protein [Clostridia bacterium]|nr:helix-turn-helix domain-containing protein [Clostridia bacterium]